MVGAIFIGTFLPLALLLLLLRHSRPVFSCFCWGMLAFLIVYLTSPTLYRILGIENVLSITAVYIGPPYEELLKAMPLLVAAIISRQSIIPFYYILGMSSGIGFAIEENLNFLAEFHSKPGESMALMTLRSFSTCLMHGVCTGFIGFTLTLARRDPTWKRNVFPIAGWLVATIYHGFFNWLMIHGFLAAGVILAMVVFLIFFGWMKSEESKAKETEGTIWQ
ncbi:MAG: PrsW family intramembrane metalloprotease [Verrucomicrobiales bacterium]|nr:PrsW family intramembrane metalloprotease [Verrucomicrobiales bacterium]